SGAACFPDFLEDLQKTAILVITNSDCSTRLSTAIADGMICLFDPGGTAVDWCASDDGAPIFAPLGITVQIGIQGKRRGCSPDGTKPLVNLRVAFYLGWIAENAF